MKKIQLDIPQPGATLEGYTANGIASASGNKEITEEEIIVNAHFT